MPADRKHLKTDLCVIGGGPAGLFAAITALCNGSEAVLIEQNTVACRKLMYTGGKRCNFTHIGSIPEFVRAYDFCGRFLRHSLHEFSPEHLRQYFAEQGLASKVEKDGCVFPVTDRAGDVARILTMHGRQLGVNFLYDKKVTSIEKDGDIFVVNTNLQTVTAPTVIIATGGVTWPFTGSTGDGYKFAQAFGHTIIQPRSALAPLITAEHWPGKLAGVSVPLVTIKTVLPGGSKKRASGSLMFTKQGIGGSAPFDLSRFLTDFLPARNEPIAINVDLMTEYQQIELENRIIELCAQQPKKELAGVLAQFLPRSLMLNLCQQASPAKNILAGNLSKELRRQIVKLLKELPLSITAAAPVADATVTRGGIDTSEIDPRTMASKLCKNLFFAGEVINADGPCGGFNLQIAFSTGYLAGKSVANRS